MSNLANIKPNREKALFLVKKHLPEFVCDAVNLENINFALPEVQTLLNGMTISGRHFNEQMITLNQANAWQALFDWIKADKFSLSKDVACDLHAIAAREESLKWGVFRQGDVTIAGAAYTPPKANQLDDCWQQMLKAANKIDDIYDKAIFVFLQMARNRFFDDVNKRMGRFMMNGLLLQSGYPAINLPAAKQLTFNQLMLDFYASNDTKAMTAFMRGCLDRRIVEIMSE